MEISNDENVSPFENSKEVDHISTANIKKFVYEVINGQIKPYFNRLKTAKLILKYAASLI